MEIVQILIISTACK